MNNQATEVQLSWRHGQHN